MPVYTVSLTDGTTLANLAVAAGRGPKGDGFTGVTFDNTTKTFTFTSNDGLGFTSDPITIDLLADPTPQLGGNLDLNSNDITGTGDINITGGMTLTGAINGPSTFTIDPAGHGDNTGTVIIAGNLQVDGTTTTINSQTLDVADLNITVASGAADAASADGAGLTVDGANATLTYVAAGDKWVFNKPVDVTSLAVSGDVSFGDNDKAIFGAGSDLQIYHDGANSNIKDAGTGPLKIFATDLYVNNSAGSKTHLSGIDGGAVTLYHNGSAKLATTATGIDVTGTVTADGLTVDGNTTNRSYSKTFFTNGAGTNKWQIWNENVSGADKFQLVDGSGQLVFQAEQTGDISFYEDTGTTPKFFWDASAESLGIGTSSPAATLEISKSSDSVSGPTLRLSNPSSAVDVGVSAGEIEFFKGDLSTGGAGVVSFIKSIPTDLGGQYDLTFGSGTSATVTERLRIDASGNVGIGVSNPSSYQGNADNLVVGNLVDAGTGLTIVSGTASLGSIHFADSPTGDDSYRGFIQYDHASNYMRFATDASERMRITSTGNVGIGTSSPAQKLHVSGTGNTAIIIQDSSAVAYLDFKTGAGTQRILGGAGGTNTMLFYTGLTERMRIDASGNVGIGVTPSAWNGAYKAVQLPTGSIVSPNNGSLGIGANIYTDGAATNRYVANGFSTYHDQTNGQYRWFTAPSGTAGNAITFSQAMTLDASGNLLVGKTSASSTIAGVQAISDGRLFATVSNDHTLIGNRLSSDGAIATFQKDGTTVGSIGALTSDIVIGSRNDVGFKIYAPNSDGTSSTIHPIKPVNGAAIDAKMDLGYSVGRFKDLYLSGGLRGDTTFKNNAGTTEYARFDASGNLLVGTTSASPGTDNVTGIALGSAGYISITRDGNASGQFNRKTSDGDIILFAQDSITEGSISVSGTTVSYNGGHLSRWAQFPDNLRPELLKGTVMSNLDQMSQWDNEDNEQLNCIQVSDVEGDANVAGVFVAWDSTDDGYNDILLAMTGDMVIRIGAGVTVARGDLLMSAGDGTAKPQGDDIVRSKTIAKVTSTHVSHTYADGSYAVPCVLMAC